MKNLTIAQKFEIACLSDSIYDSIRSAHSRDIHNFSGFGRLLPDFGIYYFDKIETFTLKDRLVEVLKDYVLDLNCDLGEAIKDRDVMSDLFYLLQDSFVSEDIDVNRKSNFNITIHD